MNLGKLYDYIQFVSTKENSGKTYDPEKFNLVLPVAVQEMYDEILANYERDLKITEEIKPYVTVIPDPGLQLDSDGIATLPTDYYRFVGCRFKYARTVNTAPVYSWRPISFISTSQYDIRITKQGATMPTMKYPICTVRQNSIEFYPANMRGIKFTYIKKAETPLYDYYINSSGLEIFLSTGEKHKLLAGEVGSQGQTVVGTILTSLTVELSMYEGTHLRIANKMLSRVGVNLSNAQLFQYAEIMQQKESK